MSSHLPDSSKDLAQVLADDYPPLGQYWPNLVKVSVPQALFLLDQGRESVYGGAARGGKSDALLAAALQYVDVPGYAALILRRTFPELRGADGLLARAHSWLTRTDAKWNEQTRTWTFPSGAVLEFGHVETEQDRFKYDGRAYQYVGFDELTSFAELQYDHIGFTRTSPQVAVPVPLRTRGSCTPTGVGVGWVKKRFITRRADDVTFVPASVVDNPGVDATQYAASLERVPEDLRKRLLYGDWEAFEGAAFDVTDASLIDRFELPDAFDRFEALDYGFNGAPWALVAVDYEGNLVFVDMLYERDMIVSHLAPLVIAKRKGGWGFGHPAYCDPSVWHRTGTLNRFSRPAMLADEFTDNGVPIVPANNDPRAGLMRVRELLSCEETHLFPQWHPLAGEPGSPRLFFHQSNCAALIEELQSAPVLPLDSGKSGAGEVVDPGWESAHGHACAMARYAVMTRPSPSTEAREPLPDPRAELLRKVREERDGNAQRLNRRRYINA